MDAIRTETRGAIDLARARQWLSRHRGQVIELSPAGQLELGVPITGAGAVLVAVTLQNSRDRAPELGGVVRALASPVEGEPIRLVFEGRSPTHLAPAQAQSAASELLVAMSELLAEDDPIAEVA
jgi:hypothetical protein